MEHPSGLYHVILPVTLRLPFQCSSWNTVMSSWNSSMVRPRFDSSMNRNAPMPVLGLSTSSWCPCCKQYAIKCMNSTLGLGMLMESNLHCFQALPVA